MQYIQAAVAKLETIKSGMQLRHAVSTMDVITTIHKGKECRARIEPTLQRSCCSFLPTTADALLDPSDPVDHKAQAVVTSALSTRDAVLNGSGVLLQLRQYKDFDLEIHVCGRCDRCSRYLVECVFGVAWVIGCCNARIEHGNINSIVPLSTNPA